ncbi:PIN domain-containing protein [Empedobacter brevis]|uniref:PIN domain-containing protein n=1 Tax=Empedobacter brevis TaxID=247 RepID=UPI0028D614AF|nr:PIN domain-containing protein [Empedobacter brevis]
MRILLDTNILIHREASKVYNQDIGLLFHWLDKLHYEKCIHPATVDEINSYKDEEVVNTMKIKIVNYNVLRTLSQDTAQTLYLNSLDKIQNDFNDTAILKELLNNRVDYLITEDKGIHRKAKFLGISEKVFKIDSFIEKVSFENPELSDYKVLSVKKDFFGNINLKDNFFSSFLEDYQEFEWWFNKKSDNISYICETNGEVKAFLYLKVEDANSENYNDITPVFQPKKRLKIGTFKVESTGYKLGERFLKIIFDNALRNNVEEIYVTIFDKREEQQRLISLLEEWGFVHWGTKQTQNGIEQVLVRDFRKLINPKPQLSFPYVSRLSNKFIVSIYPDYHTDLFPDSILNNESSEEFVENEPHRNALKKVFISRSFNRNLNPGDIILFYRTGGHYQGVVSTLGIVDSVIQNITSEEKFVELCRKRSVFSDEELKKHWNHNPNYRPFIVNFFYVDSFPTPKVNLKRLLELKIINSAPRGFEPIENSKFDELMREARANESYIVD